MGFLKPKYPTSDTPGADPQPQRRESRAARREREQHERIDAAMKEGWRNARRASKERDARFWADYERSNGPGSVDWHG